MTKIESFPSLLELAGRREQLLTKITKAEVYLQEAKDNWAVHIKLDHQGWPATTCHSCLHLRQVILSNTEYIREAKRELQDIAEKIGV